MPRLAAKAYKECCATLDRVAEKKERIILQRHGKDIVVLIPVENLALQEELEDQLDVEDFRAAKEEWEREGRQTTSLEEGVKELGIKA